jgi:MOSC domain-containing protein YiiM
MPMTLASISVGLPQAVTHGTGTVQTGIFKRPVNGPVRVHAAQLDGDGQADLVHHGGPDKAVYAYSLEHYAWWQHTLGIDTALAHGQFGENLTVAGLDEAALCLGDTLAIGSARFVVTQPRVPCFKLRLRFGNPAMPRLFAQSLRSGAYLRVLQQGTIAPGDAVDVVDSPADKISIRDLFAAYLAPNDPAATTLLRRALSVPALSGEWRRQIAQRLERRAAT